MTLKVNGQPPSTNGRYHHGGRGAVRAKSYPSSKKGRETIPYHGPLGVHADVFLAHFEAYWGQFGSLVVPKNLKSEPF